MITAKIEVDWIGCDDYAPDESFFMNFEIMPQVGDRIRFHGEGDEKITKLAKSKGMHPGSISYVRRFINDGGAQPIIRVGPDPQKIHIWIYRASSNDPKYENVHHFITPGTLPRRGDQIRVISKTENGEPYDKWLFVKYIYHDKWARVHVATSVNRVEPFTEVSIPKAIDANIVNTVTTYVDNTVSVQPDGFFPVEVENRSPIEVEVSNRCIYVSSYDKYGE